MIPENVAKASADDLVIRLNGNLEQHKLKKDTEVVSFAARAQSHRARARMRCEIGDVRSRISAYERARARTQVRARMWRSWRRLGRTPRPPAMTGRVWLAVWAAASIGGRELFALVETLISGCPRSALAAPRTAHTGGARAGRRLGARASLSYRSGTPRPPSHVRPLSSRHAAARRSPTPLTRTLSSSRRDRLTLMTRRLRACPRCAAASHAKQEERDGSSGHARRGRGHDDVLGTGG